jgi:CubicO group peptidase (beta-lactamase class C family)
VGENSNTLVSAVLNEQKIHGFCDDKFLSLQETFEGNFKQGLECGASLAVTLEGETVVDLWGGFADAAQQKPWREDTTVLVYSTTKIFTALCGLMLIDRGLLDIDKPIAHYWPEFAQQGKEAVLVRHAFTHTAGLPGWSPPIPFSTYYDWEAVTRTLAEQALWWEPGAKTGYHGQTFGFLVGELVRRISGQTVGDFLRTEVTDKIGADFVIGMAPSEFHRLAEAVPAGERLPEEGTMAWRVANGELPPKWDRLECLTSEIPASNGIGNARSIAQLGSILAGNGEYMGHRFLSPGTVDLALTEQSYRVDEIVEIPIRYGFGMGLDSAEFRCLGDRSLHWGGYGGSFCMMDVESKSCIAYAMNRLLPDVIGDPRNDALRDAFFDVMAKI